MKLTDLFEKIKPTTLNEVVGQKHLIGQNKPLSTLDDFTSIILYGPPGVGKTLIAELIAKQSNKTFVKLNATTSNKKEMEKIPKDGSHLLFVDEIHRFNKLQQDYLLPFIESGEISLIGATTENPYFEVNAALLSRSLIFKLEPLPIEDLTTLSLRTLESLNVFADTDAVDRIVTLAAPDGRRTIALTYYASELAKKENSDNPHITNKTVKNLEQIRSTPNNDDAHYDTVSAFIKSMRGSDPDATLYYLARLIESGEPIEFIGRRIIISAAEDVGIANPHALPLAVAADQAARQIGLPEARIPLAEAALYNAMSPKSNSAYIGIDKAREAIKISAPIPAHLRDYHYKGASKLHGESTYQYPFDYPNAFINTPYLPKEINELFYYPTCLGEEKALVEYQKAIRKDSGYEKQTTGHTE